MVQIQGRFSVRVDIAALQKQIQMADNINSPNYSKDSQPEQQTADE